MADDDIGPQTNEGPEEEQPQPPAAAGSMKIVFIAVAVTLVLAANAFFVFYMLTKEKAPANPSETGVAEEPTEEGAPEQMSLTDVLKNGGVFTLEPILVNLVDEEARRILRARIQLVFASAENLEEVKKSEVAKAVIQDAALNILSKKRSSDVDTEDGRVQLRQELASGVQQAIGGLEISDVLLTDFVIQY